MITPNQRNTVLISTACDLEKTMQVAKHIYLAGLVFIILGLVLSLTSFFRLIPAIPAYFGLTIFVVGSMFVLVRPILKLVLIKTEILRRDYLLRVQGELDNTLTQSLISKAEPNEELMTKYQAQTTTKYQDQDQSQHLHQDKEHAQTLLQAVNEHQSNNSQPSWESLASSGDETLTAWDNNQTHTDGAVLTENESSHESLVKEDHMPRAPLKEQDLSKLPKLDYTNRRKAKNDTFNFFVMMLLILTFILSVTFIIWDNFKYGYW